MPRRIEKKEKVESCSTFSFGSNLAIVVIQQFFNRFDLLGVNL
jgi:hypothetical protein